MVATPDVIAAIHQGNETIISRLYEEHRDAFFAWARKSFGLDDDTLVDIYQDAVIILYQNVMEEKITELKSSIRTYLFGIAKHLIFRELRSRKKSPVQLDRVAEIAVAPKYLAYEEEDHQRQVVRQALSALGDTCRQLIEYFYYYNYSMEIIAQRMRYKNSDTVKAKKHRCMKQLEQFYKEQNPSV